MTQHKEDTTIRTVFEIINAGGMENSGDAISILVNEAMKAEIHRRNFLLDLRKRGLHGAQLITIDDHSGLKSALTSVFPSVPWQR